MKKITLWLLLLFVTWQAGAQSIVIGSGATTTNGTGSDPVDGYFNSFRYQVVYTATELSTLLTPYDEITALGFSVSEDYGGGSLLGYTIKMGHTSATDCAAHNTALTTVVKGPFDYDPTITNAGEFDMITFDTNFVWNGVDNVLVEICSDGQNPYTSPYGGVRADSFTNGSRVYRTDGGTSCGVATSSTNSNRPQIQFDYVDGTLPSCYNPAYISASNITSSGFDLLFTDASGGNQYEFYYVVQPQGTGVPGTFPSGTLEEGINTADYIDYVVPVSGLNPNTDYEIYIAAGCNGTWVGPINFTTLCSAVSDFSEDFDGVSTPDLPSCWSSILDNGVSSYAYVQTYGWSSNSGANSVALNNSDSPAASNIILVSPNLNNLGAGTHRLKFFAYSYSNSVEIGTLSDPTDGSTFTPFQTVALTSSFEQYYVDFSAYSGSDTYIGFRNSNDYTYSSVYIDDAIWEAIPTTVPSCATNVVATPDAFCGNYENVLTWEAATGAEGYYLTIGTTSGGNEVLDNEDLGTDLTYSFSGLANTTYYYTVVPYNAVGSATCAVESFTTSVNNCYCASEPTSVDGDGITNIVISSVDYPSIVDAAPFYNDYSATTVDMYRGVQNSLDIAFSVPSWGTASYDYNVVIWIDMNDDYVLDSSEIVYSGVSPTTEAPTYLNASFVIPTGVNLGNHRMRIVATDALLDPANPCYSGTYGETYDFTVNVVEASCSPATLASTTIVPDCVNSQFNVELDVTALGDGTPSVTDGTNTWNITSTGVVTVGPFTSGSQVSLTLLHGSDNTCDLNLGDFVYTCPPANDECDNAIALTVNSDLNCGTVTSSTTVAATDSGIESSIPVTGTPNNDVWFSFEATATSHQISLSNIVAVVGTSVDMGMAVFSGSCSSFALVADSDPNSFTVSGLTIGDTYYVSVYGWSSGTSTAQTNFDICVGTPPAAPSNDECDNAIGLTVNSDLNCGTVTSGTTVSATDSGIEPGIAVTGTPNNDVWFSFEATATSHQISLSNIVAVVGTSVDMGMAVFSGSCSSFALVADSDPNSFTVSGLTIGDTYYVSVYGWASGTGTAQTNFDICVGTPPAAPSNDECDNAIGLTVNSDLNCGTVTSGTTVSATDSGIEPGISVTGTPNNDVWFSFEATATSHQISLSNIVAVVGTSVDMGMAVFSGSCSSIALVADSDPESFTVSGLTIGETYYISVYGWSSGTGTAQTNFNICVGTDPALSNSDFEVFDSFKAYPNPVRDILNLEYSSDITDIRIVNMLGQEVLVQRANATSTQVNMANLAAGTYVVNVQVGDAVKTLKVIKQ